jgi:hypothetical protein
MLGSSQDRGLPHARARAEEGGTGLEHRRQDVLVRQRVDTNAADERVVALASASRAAVGLERQSIPAKRFELRRRSHCFRHAPTLTDLRLSSERRPTRKVADPRSTLC